MPDHQDCPFCRNRNIVIENEYAFADHDTYPASPGHSLVVTKRHFPEYFDASPEEKAALWSLVDEMKSIIDKTHQPDAYNVGINIGKTAGQSIPHVHIHLIPRYKGDVENPQGGVRGVIPHKQKYVRKQKD